MGFGIIVGFFVVDLCVILFDGFYYDVDFFVMVFEIVVKGAFREGIFKCVLKFLEFVMEVDVIILEEFMGDVIGDLNFCCGVVNEFGDKSGGMKTVKAFVSFAEMFNYVFKLCGMIKGCVNYFMKFVCYEFVFMVI